MLRIGDAVAVSIQWLGQYGAPDVNPFFRPYFHTRLQMSRILDLFYDCWCFGLVICRSIEREPIYKGRRLSSWVAQLRYARQHLHGVDLETDPTYQDAVSGIRAIGTNGIPFALRQLSIKTSRMDEMWKVISKRLRIKRNTSNEPFILHLQGSSVFLTLREQAVPAIPRLVVIARDPSCAMDACNCLACIGPAAAPSLLSLATNQNSRVRGAALQGLMGLFRFMPESKTILNAILRGLRDRDVVVRTGTINWMRERCWLDSDFPSKLEKLLNDKDADTHELVTSALEILKGASH